MKRELPSELWAARIKLVDRFLNECSNKMAAAITLKSATYEIYLDWCRKNETSPMSKVAFGLVMKNQFAAYRSGPRRYWVGFELLPAFRKAA